VLFAKISSLHAFTMTILRIELLILLYIEVAAEIAISFIQLWHCFILS